jgi:hypothetical protein
MEDTTYSIQRNKMKTFFIENKIDFINALLDGYDPERKVGKCLFEKKFIKEAIVATGDFYLDMALIHYADQMKIERLKRNPFLNTAKKIVSDGDEAIAVISALSLARIEGIEEVKEWMIDYWLFTDLPKKNVKLDFTDDAKEVINYFKDDTFTVLSDEIEVTIEDFAKAIKVMLNLVKSEDDEDDE